MKSKICDIHAHIIPTIDDGSSSFSMSMEMLHAAYKQGTHCIVCTSHSWGDMERYFQKFKILQRQVEQEDLGIALYTGCEINCNESNIKEIIDGLDDGEIPTINRTQHILVEFNPNISANEIMCCVKQLHKYGYKTVIAHVERYPNLFAESKWIPLLQEMGCLFQINVYSICDERKTQIKTFAHKLLKEKSVSFLGSDAHRTEHRPYMIENGINYLYDHFDNEYIEDICYKNAERILNIKI